MHNRLLGACLEERCRPFGEIQNRPPPPRESTGATRLTEQEIAAFLHFGYVPHIPDDRSSLPGWSLTQRSRLDLPQSQEAVVDCGIDLFRSLFDNNVGSSLNVVPLSGGVDSRAILAELCRRGLRDSTVAVTLGVPGALDFDLGGLVADAAGVRHEALNLYEHDVSESELRHTVSGLQLPIWVFDAQYHRLIRRQMGLEGFYWSGYLGGELSASDHLYPKPVLTWPQALSHFVADSSWSGSVRLSPPGFDPWAALPDAPLRVHSLFGYDEQLYYWLRQENLIRSAVMPSDSNDVAPFTHDAWIQFMLSIPRGGARLALYHAIMTQSYPDLFRLPVKTPGFGGRPLSPTALEWLSWQRERLQRFIVHSLLRRPHMRYVNYIPFADALRTEPLGELVAGRLRCLEERGEIPWVDIPQIWDEHLRDDSDHSLALTLLVSLEIWFATNANAGGTS